ncbi:hypothetical protein GCM10011519_15690 [Marmoricola endophyticus]|uniref:Uncharacterized protein n=1 Tax=Marmoricola endophyticus TaxID=2040280 RepID=A0A917BFZ9_9ACTN|nr:MafI family immunity protein [Marmoricola endophyticus]GGF42664.1 hypothetical protein GCM10011519_15690 [Marmoricola endophyticus]
MEEGTRHCASDRIRWDAIAARCQALFASLGTHVEPWVLEEPEALWGAGEWGLAFEEACDNIYESDTRVFPAEVAEIESLGEALHSTRRSWRRVRELVPE